jgi:hypothetical protein
MVEHAAVNRDVEGSSPSSGAIFSPVEYQRVSLSRRLKNAKVCEKLCEKRRLRYNSG